jgi:RNA polymerase sigma-70 factor (ECF subfamily)
VLQEVFKTVAQAIKGFVADGRPGAFRRWLYSITRNRLLEEWRRQRKQPVAAGGSWFDQVPGPPPPPVDEDDTSQQWIVYEGVFKQVRDRFEARTLEAARQVVVERRSAQDVAKALGVSVAVVHTAKSRVLKYLREEFAELLT